METVAQEAAARFRSENRLGSQPISDLITVIERGMGVDVAVLDVTQDEHGIAARSPHTNTVFIAVARTKNPMRQRSSLAHELAHVMFGDWFDGRQVEKRDMVEIRADAFARHLLLPAEAIHAEFPEGTELTESDLSFLVQRFRVSPAMASIALYQCGCISARRKDDWMHLTTPSLATRHGWTDFYKTLQTSSDHPRAPQKLLERAVAGYTEGLVSASAIAALRGMSLLDVERELEDAGVFPRDQEMEVESSDSMPSVSVDLSVLDELDDIGANAENSR